MAGGIEELRNLPLSNLFSGPLIAAIDASVQAQRDKLELINQLAYDDQGNLITVDFRYTTTRVGPETGEEERVVNRISIPILLFLEMPNLVVREIEQEFSARITEVEEPEERAPIAPGLAPVRRLKVSPAGRRRASDRETREEYDMDVRMIAELENQSAGLELLDRAANNAVTEHFDEDATRRLRERERESEEE